MRLAEQPSPTPGIGAPQITVGLIEGGINTNVVPDRVAFRIDRRIVPEEDGAEVEADLVRRLEQAHAGGETSIVCRRIMLAEPLRPLAGVERLIEPLQRHAADVLGESVPTAAVPLYTDARHYAAAGIPVVLYGAGPRSITEAGAHGADEHLRLTDLRAATEIVALAVGEILGAN